MNLQPLTLADCVLPAWDAHARVRALVTTRSGGVSRPPYGRWDGHALPGGLNLGLHTGDERADVLENRARLVSLAGVRAAWLEQVHGDVIADAAAIAAADDAPIKADASVTDAPGVACLVMVADCLPVLFADNAGRAVGAAHAGWRGLSLGIVEKTAARVAQLAGTDTGALQAYLGPAIGPAAFEVGDDVREAFMACADGRERAPTSAAFVARPDAPGKYWADIYTLARLRLARHGIVRVTGGDACTVTDEARFYSYRRDRITGRMAAMIWLAD
jgi:YfiH family protein